MKRGFEKVSFKMFDKKLKEKVANTKELYDNMLMPSRATSHSAGYDIFSLFHFVLAPGKSIVIPTGLKAYMKEDEYLSIHVRSSAGFKFGIALKNQVGIIDSDYYNNSDNEGHILIAFTNLSEDREWVVKKDEAIAQAIFHNYLLADGDSFVQNKKRLGGIGSTSNK
jgi:dUTP pyrophosphatase